MTKFVRPLMFVFFAMSLLLAACGGAQTTTEAPVVEPTTAPAESTAAPAQQTTAPAEDSLAIYAPDAVSGDIVTAGSSTVFPVLYKTAERYSKPGNSLL